jgi:hypothetical protein
MPVKTYEALLASPANIAQVESTRLVIERAGGRVKLAPPTSSGMVLVTLILPDRYTPQDFLPGLPFYVI